MGLDMEQGIWWYGYRHTNGSLHVKRFFNEDDYSEARDSDFVDRIYGPWECNRDEAIEKLKKEVLEG